MVLITAAPAFALDPTKPVAEYALDRWRGGREMPGSTVRSIQQTPDGYLWLGTQSGLVRFDGARFTAFGAWDTPQISHNHVWVVRVARDGSLWIGTNAGLSRFKDGEFTGYGAQGLPSGIVRALHEGSDGSLWIGTENGGLSRWKREAGGVYSPLRTYTTADGLEGASIHALAETRDGSLLIGTNQGLHRLFGGTIVPLEKGQLGGVQIWVLLTVRDGSVWLGTEGRGLFHWRDGRLERYDTASGLPDDIVRALCEDRDGNLWIGTNRGLARLTRGRLSHLGSPHGLSSSLVRSLHEDADGSLWIGFYGGGISRLRNGEFTTYDSRHGLAHDLTWSGVDAKDGSVWVTTHGGGVSRLKNGRFTTYTTASGLAHNVVRPVLEDREGDIWFGTNGGASRLQRGRFTRYTTRDGLAHDIVQALHQGRDGSLWFGTWGGLTRLRDGVFESYLAPDAAGNYIRAVHQDRQGVVWVGSSAGLSRLTGTELVPYVPRPRWSPVSVEAIHEDEEGTLWLGTDGSGLVRKRGDEWTAITRRDGLFDDTVFHIVGDGAGNLWLGGSSGVFKVNRGLLDDLAAGRTQRVAFTAYGVAHGMESSECTGGGAQPGAFRGRDGRLWFPTNKGIVSVDPRSLSAGAPPPPVLIEETHVNGRPLARGRPVIGPGRGDLEVRYTAINLVSPQMLRFRYRLDGQDEDWVEAGERRVAYYTNLTPGSYRFLASASNDGLHWAAPVATVELWLRPHFYQMPWFRGLVLSGLALSVLALHRLRTSRLRANQARLLQMVDERTRELQAEVAEHRRSEAALREERATLNSVLEQIPDHVYFKDAQSRFTRINAALARWFGLADPEQALGKTDFDFFGAEHARQAFADESEIMRTGSSLAGKEEKETWPDGRVTWVHSTKMPLRDHDGRTVGTMGISRDITGRKQVEQELRRHREQLELLVSERTAELRQTNEQLRREIAERREAEQGLRRAEEKYRAIFEQAVEGIYRTTPDGRILVANPAMARILGYASPEELIAETTNVASQYYVDPEKRLDFQKLVDELGTIRAFENQVRRRDGGLIWVSISARAERDEAGRVLYYEGQLEDITERKRAEEAQARLRSAVDKAAVEWALTFDAMETPILIVDAGGRIIRCNRAAAELVRTDPAPLEGVTVSSLGPAEPWREIARLAQQTASTFVHGRAEARDATAGRIWDLTADPVPGPSEAKRYVIVVARDVTRLSALQDSLRRSETMSALGMLIAGVAHEVRNPLFGISANLDAFELRSGASPEIKGITAMIRSEVERLASLMRDLLDYGQPAQTARSPDSLQAVVADAVRACAGLARLGGVSLSNEVAAALPLVLMDRKRLAQVFQNLLQNAIQHSPTGGAVVIAARQEPGVSPPAVILTVSDSGPGFAPEDLPRIFEPFFSRRRGGTGLGLAIVQRIVEQHGGTISAANRPEGGATISLRLPGLESRPSAA